MVDAPRPPTWSSARRAARQVEAAVGADPRSRHHRAGPGSLDPAPPHPRLPPHRLGGRARSAAASPPRGSPSSCAICRAAAPIRDPRRLAAEAVETPHGPSRSWGYRDVRRTPTGTSPRSRGRCSRTPLQLPSCSWSPARSANTNRGAPRSDRRSRCSGGRKCAAVHSEGVEIGLPLDQPALPAGAVPGRGGSGGGQGRDRSTPATRAPPKALAYPYSASDEAVERLCGACGYTCGPPVEVSAARFDDPLLSLPRM